MRRDLPVSPSPLPPPVRFFRVELRAFSPLSTLRARYRAPSFPFPFSLLELSLRISIEFCRAPSSVRGSGAFFPFSFFSLKNSLRGSSASAFFFSFLVGPFLSPLSPPTRLKGENNVGGGLIWSYGLFPPLFPPP